MLGGRSLEYLHLQQRPELRVLHRGLVRRVAAGRAPGAGTKEDRAAEARRPVGGPSAAAVGQRPGRGGRKA